MEALLSSLPVSGTAYLAISATLTAAYVIFGMAGFGTALIAGPVLAYFMPVAAIVPLLALLDASAALLNVARDARRASVAELGRLVPFMALGSLIGAALLLRTRPDVLVPVLGAFAVAYALYSLRPGKPRRRWAPGAAAAFGSVGGVFSALFGSGGFFYAIYLAGRIDDKDGIRVTQSALIGLSTLWRLVLFLLAGVYGDGRLAWLAVCLAPAMLLGTAVGRRLTLRTSRDAFMRLLSVIILATGASLIARSFL